MFSSLRRTMRAKIGFAVLLGLIYAAMGLRGAFGVTSFDFWSGLLLCLGMVTVLPLSILSIWRTRLAGRLLLVDAVFVVCASLLEAGSKEEALASLVVGFPMVMSALLLLKEPQSTS
jgi:hypothetical protein